MMKFIYNNTKNASISHVPFELNFGYYLRVFYKKDVDFCLKSKLVDKLSTKLQELKIVCYENLYHT